MAKIVNVADLLTETLQQVGIRRVYGVAGDSLNGIAGAIRDVLGHPGPALLDAVTNRQELALPPKIEAARMKGFSLYALRAAMNGRGDEIVDLAKSNLPR